MDDENTDNRQPEHKPRPLIDLLVSIVMPSFILMKMSGPEQFGPVVALVVALSFPLGWGLFELARYRKFNFIAVLGLVSVSLTGGIGLLQLDTQWLAVKEAAIPAIIGLAVLVSAYTPYPLVRTLLYNPRVLDIGKIDNRLHELGHHQLFESRLQNATYFLSITFLFSAIMNYVLAKWIVTSPTGSPEFNEQLGRMTLLSYPVIALPSTLMMMALLYYLWKTISSLTGFTLEEVVAQEQG